MTMKKREKKLFPVIFKSCTSPESDGTKMTIYADAYLRLNKSSFTINNAAHKVDSGSHDK